MEQLNLFTEAELKLRNDLIIHALEVPDVQTVAIDLNHWELVSEEINERNILEIKLKKKSKED